VQIYTLFLIPQTFFLFFFKIIPKRTSKTLNTRDYTKKKNREVFILQAICYYRTINTSKNKIELPKKSH